MDEENKMEIAKKYRDQLPRIKKNVEDSYESFKDNYRYWHNMKRFIYVSTLDTLQKTALAQLKKPELEFNILEAFIARLVGEFSLNEPSVKVSSIDNEAIDTSKIIEGNMRYIESDSRKNGTAISLFSDMLSGGFSVARVCTDWENDKSFNQIIKYDKVRDPTLCGFDPTANTITKRDGKYCSEVCPKFAEEVEKEYPGIDLSKISYAKTLSGFSWSIKTNKNEKVVLVCDYYEKEKKRRKIVRLSTGQTMTQEEYNKFVELWNQRAIVEQVPQIVDSRYTEIEEIVRYKFIEDQVLEYERTDYKFLPLVFFDGNSVTYRDNDSGKTVQVTRSLVHNAIGVQKLKDFAGQTQAAELENMIQNKFIAPVEAISAKYLDAWRNPQDSQVLLYNQFLNNDPNTRIDPPRELARPDIPQSVMVTFTSADQMIQNILGSYDATLGINKSDISGVAFDKAATSSNSASRIFFENYKFGLSQVFTIILDLIPKYYKTPATIPVVDDEGKRSYIKINQMNQQTFGGIKENSLNIEVESGANFEVQKDIAVKTITSMMQASPVFADFFNKKCMGILLDNLDFRGADRTKEYFKEYQMEQQQAAQQQAQMQQQMLQQDPMYIAAQNDRMRVQVTAAQNDVENRRKAAELVLEQQKLADEHLKTVSQIQSDRVKDAISVGKLRDDRISKVVDMAVKASKDIAQEQIIGG